MKNANSLIWAPLSIFVSPVAPVLGNAATPIRNSTDVTATANLLVRATMVPSCYISYIYINALTNFIGLFLRGFLLGNFHAVLHGMQCCTHSRYEENSAHGSRHDNDLCSGAVNHKRVSALRLIYQMYPKGVVSNGNSLSNN